MKKLTQILLPILVAASAQVASALNYNAADLLLAFHLGGYNDVVYDIGPAGNYTGLPVGTIVPVSYDASLVTSNFGGALAGIGFAVVGEKDSESHLWLTDTDTGATPGDLTPGTYAPLQAKINSVGVIGSLITGGGASPLVIDPSDANSYSYIVSPGDAGNVSTMGGDAPFTVSGVCPAELALYRLIPTTFSPTPTAVKLGTFTLLASGTIFFTAGSPAPVVTSISGPGVTARGGNATFTATAEGATGFQWYVNGVAIAGATNSSLTVSNVQPGDVGNYTVVANNSTYATTSAASSSAALKVSPAYVATDLLLVFHDGINPDVEFNLGSVSNYLGQANGTAKTISYNAGLVISNFGTLSGVSASLVAASDVPLARVWLSDADAGSTPGDLTPNTYATLGSKVDNAGTAAAAIAQSIDYNNPFIIDPSDANSYSSIVSPGDPGNVDTFGGDAPFTVGAALPALIAFYELHPTTSNPAPAATFVGAFNLGTNGSVKFVASSSAPVIVTQPANQPFPSVGSDATFTVVAAGTPALHYQWRFNGANLAGANASSFTRSNAQVTDAGAYTVVVTNAAGAVTSAVATLAIDSTLPMVTIKTPGNNARLGNTNALFLVTGTAKDTGGSALASVLWGINGGPVTNPATSTDGFLNWKANVPLHTGYNTFAVKSKDNAGNETAVPAARNLYLVVTKALTIVTNAPGNCVVDGKGVVANAAMLEIGAKYSFDVIPNASFIFSNAIVASAVGNSNYSLPKKIGFTMQTNTVITVNAPANRFLAAAGTYHGLFQDETNGVDIKSAGYFDLTIKDKQSSLPTFSIKVSVDGEKVGGAGTFDLAGHGTLKKSLARKKSGQADLNVTLDLDLPNQQVVGTVTPTNNTWYAALGGDQVVWSATNATTNFNGLYTMVLTGAVNDAAVPGGDGYATVVIETNGLIDMKGILGDGLVWKQKNVTYSKDGYWPLFAMGNKDGSGVNKEMVWGWLTISNGASRNLSGQVAYIKSVPPAVGTVYTGGFTNIGINLMASPYQVPQPNQRMLTLTEDLGKGRGYVVFDKGGLAGAPVTVSNVLLVPTLTSDNAFEKMKFDPFTNAVSLTWSKPASLTGALKGGIKDASLTDGKANILGVVLQNQNQARGLFVNPSATKSGSFLLRAQ